MSKSVKRLYETFQPSHYKLDLNPDVQSMTFRGTVIIDGQKVGRPSQRITLHQKELKISSASIVRKDKKGEQVMSVARINHHKGLSEVRIHTKEMLFPGTYVISINFTGTVTTTMQGIYPCYFNHKGQQKNAVSHSV